MELGAAHFATVGDLHFGDPGGVDLEDPLDSLTVGNFANSEGRVHRAASLGDDDSGEKLDSLLPALTHEGVDFYGVAHAEIGNFFFELLLLDLVDDVHGVNVAKLLVAREDASEGGEGYTMPSRDAIVFSPMGAPNHSG